MSKQAKKKMDSIVLRPKLDNFKGKLAEGATSIENNGKIYDFRMDARSFKPEDVQLTIGEKRVKIDAHHETEEEETEISFEIEIPPGVEPALIEARMNKHGVLKISAPVTSPPVLDSKTVHVRSERKTETVERTRVTHRVEVEEIVETHYWEVDPPSIDPKFEDVTDCIVKSESGDNFKLTFDLPAGTTKEDVDVNVYKTVATVQVKPKKEAAEPGKLQVEICKKIALPKQTRGKTLTSVMDVQNGRFTISGLLKTPEAKKPEPKPEKAFEIKRVPPVPKKQPDGEVGLAVVVDSKTSLSPEEARAARDVTDQVMTSVASCVDGKRFETSLDVAGWKAEEIQVKAMKKVVTVRAERVGTEPLFNLFKMPPRVRHEDLQVIYTARAGGQLQISSVLQDLCPIAPKICANDASYQATPRKGVTNAEGFRHTLDMTGYSPEQIEISIKNGWIMIKAKQSVGVFDFMDNFQARQYSRKFTIPPGLEPSDVRCALDPLTNTLFITADKK